MAHPPGRLGAVRRKHLLGLLYLNIATLLWGITFVVIKQSLESLSAS